MAGDMEEKLLIPDDELGDDRLEYQGEELSLEDILEKHNLPILVQIAQGYYDDLSSHRFSGNEIIRLDCRLPVDFIEASVLPFINTHNKNKAASVDNERPASTLFSSSLMLPKSLSSMSFEVVDDMMGHMNDESSGLLRGKSRRRTSKSASTSQRKTLKRKTRFESVKSLAKHRPEFVRVLKLSNSIKKGTQLQVGQRLHVLDVPGTRFFQDKYLRCQVVDNETVGIIKLNLKWKGVFELAPERKTHLLKEIVDTYTLPATVRMQESTLSNKWINAQISTRIKQIRTLDLNVRLEREVKAHLVIGIMKGIDGDDSVVVMSETVKYRFRVCTEMQSRSSSYERMLSSIGGVEKETIPPEFFLSEHGSPVMALHKKYEMQLTTSKSGKSQNPHCRMNYDPNENNLLYNNHWAFTC